MYGEWHMTDDDECKLERFDWFQSSLAISIFDNVIDIKSRTERLQLKFV